MSELPGSIPSGAANQAVEPDVPNQEILKLPSEKEDKKKKTYKIAGIVLAVLIIGVVVALILFKNNQDTRKAASACVEECPASGGTLLRNCHPPESPGNSTDSLCNQAGRIEPCGGNNYCCPSAGGVWTRNMTACAIATPTVTVTLSPTATPSATITLSPTATPSATITLSPTATPSATITLSPTATPSATKTPSPTPTPTKTPTPTNCTNDSDCDGIPNVEDPDDDNDGTLDINEPTPTATKTPTPTATPTISSDTLPASGSVETTFLLMIASLFSIALGMAIKYKN